ncbi:hypothetical protein [Salinicola tamaricis]|uniref:hypothetical protein n=1 Tax=Salinicola tamaricis TaxID=1771309 RepID=UPI001F5DC43A|nr:hypothetical protein [Salinicola tamaricis]
MIGRLIDLFDYTYAFSLIAALGIVVAILSPFYPGYITEAQEEPEEEAGLEGAYAYQLQDEAGQPLEDPVDDALEEAKPTA